MSSSRRASLTSVQSFTWILLLCQTITKLNKYLYYVVLFQIIDAPNTIRTSQPAVILRNTNLQLGISKRIVCIPYIMVCKKESVFSNDAIVLSLPFYDSCDKVGMVSLVLTQKDIEKYGLNSSDNMIVVCGEKSKTE